MIAKNIPCDGCGTIMGNYDEADTPRGYFLTTYKTGRGTVPFVCKTCHDEHYGIHGADQTG